MANDLSRESWKNNDNRVRVGFGNKTTNAYADLPGPTQNVTNGIWITLAASAATAVIGGVIKILTKD